MTTKITKITKPRMIPYAFEVRLYLFVSFVFFVVVYMSFSVVDVYDRMVTRFGKLYSF